MRELARAGAGDDAELAAGALALMGLIGGAGKYAVSISGSPGTQVGDHNIQVNLIQESPDRRQAGAAGGKPAGRLLAEVTDPFALEVHRPVQADDPPPGLPALPAYVPREHDRKLAEVVRAAAQEGTNALAVLVGGSSTGKTRACWQALAVLRAQPEQWRLWHPIDPARPEAALRELPWVGPRTVVWLNEAQFYLDVTAGGLGEQIAAGLRELLRNPARAPVLVLATLWPAYWDALTARPQAGADLHAQARELLAGRDITVPAAFTDDQLRQLSVAGDPRLDRAAQMAEDGRVIQFLAGAPELMARYRNAPPAAAALANAAIDARRLGMGINLPLAFLEQAAPGYVTDADWDELSADWLEQALAYISAPRNGIRGPLSRVRPRPGSSTLAGTPYRLADYLEQQGRRARHDRIPPAGFWQAATRFASPGELPALARAAEDRGLLRDAARLRRQAAANGNTREAATLVRDWHLLYPYAADPNPAQWAAAHAALDDPGAVADLLRALRETGAMEQVASLAARAAPTADMLRVLMQVGTREQVASLAARAAAHATPSADMLRALRQVGTREQVASLAARAAAHATLDDPGAVDRLLRDLWEGHAEKQIAALLARDPAAHATLDDPRAVARLLRNLREGAAEPVAFARAS